MILNRRSKRRHPEAFFDLNFTSRNLVWSDDEMGHYEFEFKKLRYHLTIINTAKRQLNIQYIPTYLPTYHHGKRITYSVY